MMSNPTVRISPRSHQALRELARRSGKPMQTILDHAIEEERRRLFIAEANASYAAVHQDPKAWAALQAERAEWDATLLDGLEAEPPTRKSRRSR